MPKKKLVHFAENLTFPHLFQPHYHDLDHGFPLKGRWYPDFFRKKLPIVLEAGCGKGEYTIGLAEKYPRKNFIGMDIKGARLWRGCKTVAERKMTNVAFIRTRVDHIEKFFGHGEVSEIWITFPDPQPKKDFKRLTSPEFLAKYRNVLVPGGIIHLKTDNTEFFDYTLDVIRDHRHHLLFATQDLYHLQLPEPVSEIRTYYENIWLEQGKKICYLRFKLSRS